MMLAPEAPVTDDQATEEANSAFFAMVAGLRLLPVLLPRSVRMPSMTKCGDCSDADAGDQGEHCGQCDCCK